MINNRDYYKTLGVPRSASQDEIKKAYRKAALKHHPDRNPNSSESEDRFKEAATAYQVLSDPDKRRRFDQFGHAGLQDSGVGGFRSFDDIFDLFGDIFGGGGVLGDLFGFGGRGRRAGHQPRQGPSLKVEIVLSFQDVMSGVEKTVSLRLDELCSKCDGTGAREGARRDTCSACNGYGVVNQRSGFFMVQTTCSTCEGVGTTVKDPCKPCKGSGRVRVKREMKVTIPP